MNALPEHADAAHSSSTTQTHLLRMRRQRDLLRTHRLLLGLTQEEFAHRNGFSVRAVVDWENAGRITMASLYALRDALRMSPQAFDELFAVVTGAAPSLRSLAVDPDLDRVTARWAAVHVHTQPNPTVLMDGGWHARHYNASWVQIFDQVEPHPTDHPLTNPLRFLMFHPLAPELFPEWEERWLVTAVAQFAMHYALHPTHPALQEMRSKIHEIPLLEDLYAHRARRELAERGVDVIFEGDVDRRPVVVGPDRSEIVLTVLIPWHALDCGYQMMTMSPLDNSTLLPQDADPPGLPRESVHLRPQGPNAPRTPTPPARPRAAASSSAGQEPQGYVERALTVGQLLLWYRTRLLGLSQERLVRATELPVTVRTYGDWERDRRLPQAEYVPIIARAMKMPDGVRYYLHNLVTGADAPVVGTRLSPEVAQRSALWARIHVDGQPAPTAMMDGAWQVVYCNEPFRHLFAHVPAGPANSHPTQNWLRYVLFHSDARETLGEWRESWLAGTMADLVVSLTRQRGALPAEHRAFINDIESDPVLGDVYARSLSQNPSTSAASAPSLGDGDIRTIWIPDPTDPKTRLKRHVCVTVGVPLHGKAKGFCMLTISDRDDAATSLLS
ncbi:helix-turn-helix domain-containing protein [Streptomyces lydicus]|uniref:MmyB family transcriptional regulator n=1 Tax=Streptomyces lydicus TaxID=47763 RepID=UPI0036FE605E